MNLVWWVGFFFVDLWCFCFVSADEPTFQVKKSSDKEVFFQVRKKDNSPSKSSHCTGEQAAGQCDGYGVVIINIFMIPYMYTVYALHVIQGLSTLLLFNTTGYMCIYKRF